jgi:hypothetical protein
MNPESHRSAEMSAATETSTPPSFGSRVGSMSLALGGVVMNCGYDPDPAGHYDRG